MTVDTMINALNLPTGSRVGQRVPKKLLLENGAPTAADKRLINDGIEEIHWIAALKPATLGVPAFRDDTREYVEIAVLRMNLRPETKAARLVELLHRAVPYPALLWTALDMQIMLSLAHKRHALNETDKIVLDGDPVMAVCTGASATVETAFLDALSIARQPREDLFAFYQGWLDVAFALQAAQTTGIFKLLDSVGQLAARRAALQSCIILQAKIVSLRSAAGKASQMARQVELNIELKRTQAELEAVRAQL
jgi:hypothetical protein